MHVIYYTPDELGYTDRGKQKWMGSCSPTTPTPSTNSSNMTTCTKLTAGKTTYIFKVNSGIEGNEGMQKAH